MAGISVRLEVFEGPLDLLLHLIDKNKVSIYDIPIADITDQYMAYIRSMKTRDLNNMSEFLVMAATLLDIKSRMLLPKEVDQDGEEIDPRRELVEKLLEYKMYKYISQELKERQGYAQRAMYRKPAVPREVLEYEEPPDINAMLEGLTLQKLQRIFQSIIRKQENRSDPIRGNFGVIEKEEANLAEKLEFLAEYARSHRQFSFRALLEQQSGKMELIVTFLALLELMKAGTVTVSQEHTFDDIQIISL